MRKTIIAALFITAGFAAGAQPVDDALKQLGKNNDKAKEAIDKITADPANAKNADAWYAKAQVYNALATDDKYKAEYPMHTTRHLMLLKRHTMPIRTISA